MAIDHAVCNEPFALTKILDGALGNFVGKFAAARIKGEEIPNRNETENESKNCKSGN